MANPVFNTYFIIGAPAVVEELRARFAVHLDAPPGTPWDYSRPVWGAKLWLHEPAQGRLGMTLVTPRSPYGDPRDESEVDTLNVACVSYDQQRPWATAWRAVGGTTIESRSWNDKPEGDFEAANAEMAKWVDEHFHRFVGAAILVGHYPAGA